MSPSSPPARPGAVSAPSAADLPEPSTLGYEQARDELVDVVRRLEAGNCSLEESLGLWERGEALAQRCEEWLAGARERVDVALRRRDEQTAEGTSGTPVE